MQMLDETARLAVAEILGSDSPQAVSEACNWPDAVRETPEWEWSAPLHYVNIPRHTPHYDRQRDCPDGLCVTEGIRKYASELTQDGLDAQRRWQALAWLCHLVGDVHQPLHAGFRDDRGGNNVEIEYRGDPWNLHEFWDGVLIREYVIDEDAMTRSLALFGRHISQGQWDPDTPMAWTDESNALATAYAYPDSPVIGQEFAAQSWKIIEIRLQRASERLALILNAALGQGVMKPDA